MKRALSVFLLLFLVQIYMYPLLAQEAAEDSVAKYLALGNSLSDQWQHKEAIAAYQKALKFDPDNYEANWKTGDQYTEYANRLPDDQKIQKETYFEKARQFCEKAIEVNPQGYEGHFRLAVALGRLALFRGGKEKIMLSKMIKAEGDTALVLNPQADLVCHLLGRWHQELANLSGVLKFFAGVFFGGLPPASNEEAVAFFKRAIEIDPNHIEHYLELARTYKYMGEKELMRDPLEKLLTLPNVEEDDQKYKDEAKEMLKKL
jgi:tetratricopeptide (TPR) repeat protein